MTAINVDNPESLLVDPSGSAMAVTSGLALPAETFGIIGAGVGGDNIVRYFRIDSNDALLTTGSVGVVNIVSVTGSVGVSGQVRTYGIASGATRTSVSASNTDTLLLSGNVTRRGAIVVNDANIATLKIGLGNAAVSATDYSAMIGPGGYWEVPFGFSGTIRGIWDVSSGSARITEVTDA